MLALARIALDQEKVTIANTIGESVFFRVLGYPTRFYMWENARAYAIALACEWAIIDASRNGALTWQLEKAKGQVVITELDGRLVALDGGNVVYRGPDKPAWECIIGCLLFMSMNGHKLGQVRLSGPIEVFPSIALNLKNDAMLKDKLYMRDVLLAVSPKMIAYSSKHHEQKAKGQASMFDLLGV